MHSKRTIWLIGFIVVAVLAITFIFTTMDSVHEPPIRTTPNQIEPPKPVEPIQPPATKDKRPNIVLFLVDDMRVADLEYMPKTKRLLSQRGTTFDNMLSVNPLCCPARASLLTGQYTHNNGVLSNDGRYGGIDALIEPNNTLPVWLSKAGYQTAFFGKYLNGYNGKSPIPAGWSQWDATIQGTYAYTNFTFSNNGQPERFEEDYITTRLTQRSVNSLKQFSEDRRREGRPFFLFNSYVAPHYSIGTPKELVSKYSTFDYKKTEGPAIPEAKYSKLYQNEINPSAFKPSYGEPIVNNVIGYYRNEFNSGDWQTEFLRRVQSLASVDDAVQKVVRELKKEKQYENTVLMFVSDNGYLLGEHQRGGKQVPFNESLKVPLIISGPGFEKNKVSHKIVTTPDVSTTITRLAEAVPERMQDGRNILNIPNGANPKLAVLIENGNSSGKTPEEAYHYQGLFIGNRYTYSEWENPTEGVELYDNKYDPYQLVNLAYSPGYAPLVKIFSRTLEELHACSGSGSCSKNVSYPEVPPNKLIKYLHGTHGDKTANSAKRARHHKMHGLQSSNH